MLAGPHRFEPGGFGTAAEVERRIPFDPDAACKCESELHDCLRSFRAERPVPGDMRRACWRSPDSTSVSIATVRISEPHRAYWRTDLGDVAKQTGLDPAVADPWACAVIGMLQLVSL